MRILLLFIAFLFFFYPAFSQKHNHQWAFGYQDALDQGWGHSLLDFHDGIVTIRVLGSDPRFPVGDAATFICDRAGQLQFMANNCFAKDTAFEIIENTDTLTPGSTWKENCPDWGDYPQVCSNIALPSLQNDSTFFLIHKDSELVDQVQDVVSFKKYLSILIKRTDGSLYLKERHIVREAMMNPGKMTAVLNRDKDRWWVLANDFASNRFVFYEIGGDSLIGPPVVSELGFPLLNSEVGLSQVAFSNDGSMMAINNNAAKGVMLYDFDNKTGKLSNFRNFPYYENLNSPEGVVFSPNDRFLYLTVARHIWQFDLHDPDTATAFYDMGEVSFPDETGWPVGVGFMYMGPDCRIYVSPGTTTYYAHVIHNPNEKGAACDFEVKAIRSPTRFSFDFANTINYRLDGGCDNSIAWGVVSAVALEGTANSFKLYPNPCKGLPDGGYKARW